MGKIFSLILPVILIFLGASFLKDVLFDTTETEREQLENIINNDAKTMAILDEEYEEKTVKIAGIPVVTYEINYTLTVEGKEYRNSATLDDPPTSKHIEVTYLPADPDANSIDPQKDLERLKDQSGSFSLLLGLGLLLVGLTLGYFRIRPRPAPQTTN